MAEKAEMGSGNDGIVLTKSKPIRGTNEATRKRRDLTVVEEPEARLVIKGEEDKELIEAEIVLTEEELKALEGIKAVRDDDGEVQYTDAQGVSSGAFSSALSSLAPLLISLSYLCTYKEAARE